jgi:hypothetical protein
MHLVGTGNPNPVGRLAHQLDIGVSADRLELRTPAPGVLAGFGATHADFGPALASRDQTGQAPNPRLS